MALTKDAVAQWRGQNLDFDVTVGQSPTLHLSDHPARGISPIETLVAGLAGCTGMDVVSILQKKRQNITGVEVRVHGERVETHPKRYKTMHVTFVVTGHKVDPDAVQRAIQLSEENYCSVSATLRPTVTITTSFEIREAEAM
jgi:putative redox protein